MDVPYDEKSSKSMSICRGGVARHERNASRYSKIIINGPSKSEFSREMGISREFSGTYTSGYGAMICSDKYLGFYSAYLFIFSLGALLRSRSRRGYIQSSFSQLSLQRKIGRQTLEEH